MVKCHDCQSEAVSKSSKSGKAFFVCPKCPGTGNYDNKFLTWVDDVQEYMEKKGCIPKGKRKSTSKEAPKAKVAKLERDEALHAKVDRLLTIVEGLLKKEKQEEEVEEETSDEGSDS